MDGVSEASKTAIHLFAGAEIRPANYEFIGSSGDHGLRIWFAWLA